MTVYAKNHQSLHKIYKFGSVSQLLAMTVLAVPHNRYGGLNDPRKGRQNAQTKATT